MNSLNLMLPPQTSPTRPSAPGVSFGEERIGQGRENARLFLKEHRDIRAQVDSARKMADDAKDFSTAKAVVTRAPAGGR